MEIVYYFDLAPSDNAKRTNRKIKILAFVDQAIKFIAENNGQPIPPIAKPLRNYKFHEMCIKAGNNLIRILYFCFCKQKLVLLNAFEKPALYEKNKKQKIEKQIAKILEQTKLYYQDFIKNQNYEEYK